MWGVVGLFRDFFRKTKYAILDTPGRSPSKEQEVTTRCEECGELIHQKDIEKHFKVCSKCGYHLKMTAQERVSMLLDRGSFEEYDQNLETVDVLRFPGYQEKLETAREITGLREAVVTGQGEIEGNSAIICIMDPRFISASMGSVVGEKITRALEKAQEKKTPMVVFSASGGARMQEGILSLMQMAKTSAAVARLNAAGVLYISVLTNPTTGGVTASFASLGDVVIAEPGALIGFAGPRVIEQTIRQKLPAGFQRAEFLLQHGLIDLIVERKELRRTLSKLLALHKKA
ncbi:MAG: acetyl-CoA carboxylase carboxyltransferase subunit beta [Candidatus Syntrophonatronum acetioxidans]|uniref:Acetyl-coenzyme A carboxylase carboxyl transferase subunit beta n=1 Tax=Candidatus Syntrophonatronum acetioxidans TaxID=1795816 RepID=A0A424YIA2_9FIRM|nr:MAG: acetyl-CoA carboxylase carboxyltransferase subunit beta [Candidatus Syntrophonatronum acetioxidans]